MQLGEERRKHIRVFFPGGKVRILSGQILAHVGKIVDLSLGGMRFTSETNFSIGEVIDFEINITQDLKFKCSAKVAHFEIEGRQGMCGVSFLSMEKNDESELGKLIMKLKAEQDSSIKKEVHI